MCKPMHVLEHFFIVGGEGVLVSLMRLDVYFLDCRITCSVGVIAGTFVLSNLGMFGVDRFDAILPPGVVSNTSTRIIQFVLLTFIITESLRVCRCEIVDTLYEVIDRSLLKCHYHYCFEQGAIIAVGASIPTVVATGNGLFGVKTE